MVFRADELVEETCCSCHIRFAMPYSFQKRCREDSKVLFCCPNGHYQHYSGEQTEREALRRERDRLKQQAARLEDEAREAREDADAAKRQAAAFKGVATRIKNRVQHGVCPCCNRTFQDLARHMKSQHPDVDNIVLLQTA